jgi:hypothetical protein
MSKIYYDDGSIAVTENEIRAQGYTLYLSNVSAVSVASFSLGKFMLIPLVISFIPLGMFLFMFRAFVGLMLIPMLPLLLLVVAGCFVRKTRIMLQTTGGPVIAGQKFGFGDHAEALSRFNKMKQAIEDAKAGRPGGSAPEATAPAKWTL